MRGDRSVSGWESPERTLAFFWEVRDYPHRTPRSRLGGGWVIWRSASFLAGGADKTIWRQGVWRALPLSYLCGLAVELLLQHKPGADLPNQP
jgi:hypothetical protein